MEDKQLPTEFITQFRRSFELLSKCCIHFFNNDVSKLKKYWRLIYLVPLVALFDFSILAYTTRINSETTDIFEVAYMGSACLVSLQANLKGVIVLYKRVDIEKLIKELESIWRTSNLTDLQLLKKKRLLKRLKWCIWLYYWINISGTWQHLSAPLFLSLIRRFLLGQDCELELPFGDFFPYDPKESWLTYLPTYAFQVAPCVE